VPAFILAPDSSAAAGANAANRGLRPETRVAFMKAIEGLRAAGATVVFDDSILPDGFSGSGRVNTAPYRREGMESFLREFGPVQYQSVAAYEKAVGSPLPATVIGGPMPASAADAGTPAGRGGGRAGAAASVAAGAGAQRPPVEQADLEKDPNSDANYFAPQKKALATYNEALDRLHLDGFVYPAANMPPPDETMAQDGRLSGGPHSNTGWVNNIGVPAIVVSGGFYDDGLPFGLEISARQWKDGDLLGWAFAYEQVTKHRRPPVLVEKGLLPNAK
jgi:amidase